MARAASSNRSAPSAKWRKLLLALPGYDPIASAGDAWFDPAAAQRAIDFAHECCRHVEGALAGKAFLLERWQQAIVANLFGWKRPDGARRYRELFLFVPRKNGKTPFSAFLCLYILFCDGEAGAQIYGAAADTEQASYLYRQAKGMVEQEPELEKRSVIFKALKSIVLKADSASSYKVISAEANTKHGGNSHMVLIDELHAQPDRDLVDVLQTSFASANRRQPLFVNITTADFNRPSVCNEKLDYACKVRDRIIDDPTFLPVVYEALADKDDWTDPKVWARVNPNLGVSVSREYLERECKRAQETPAYENTFKRLHLNMKTETDVRAIPMDRWDAAAATPVRPENFEGAECYGGLDLASTTDIAALALLFPVPGGYALLPRFWVPREGARLRGRRDRVPYETWIAQGHIKATEGNSIDYDVIRQDINDFAKLYHIVELACDRWNATQIITQLQGDGLEVVAFGQGFKDMTAPTKELLRLVVEGALLHGGHPVLRWMASNTATETDAAGNLKPSKKKSTERIDGIVSLIMALGRALMRPGEVSGGMETW